MRNLLGQLSKETFLLDLKETQSVTPELEGYPAQLLDECTLQVQVEKHRGLTDLFTQLSAQGI